MKGWFELGVRNSNSILVAKQINGGNSQLDLESIHKYTFGFVFKKLKIIQLPYLFGCFHFCDYMWLLKCA